MHCNAVKPMTLQDIDLGALRVEDVEVAVNTAALCQSDLSILNNERGISRYPAILGHEVVGRVVALGPVTKIYKLDDESASGGTAVAAC
jgi:uncharacterized zinc-type alcohol dehydrogenase-like protein